MCNILQVADLEPYRSVCTVATCDLAAYSRQPMLFDARICSCCQQYLWLAGSDAHMGALQANVPAAVIQGQTQQPQMPAYAQRPQMPQPVAPLPAELNPPLPMGPPPPRPPVQFKMGSMGPPPPRFNRVQGILHYGSQTNCSCCSKHRLAKCWQH